MSNKKITTNYGYVIEEKIVTTFNGRYYEQKDIDSIKVGDVVCLKRKYEDSLFEHTGLKSNTRIHNRYTTNITNVDLPERFCPLLSKFLGYVIANGACSKNCIVFTTNNNVIADDYSKVVKSLFGIDVKKTESSSKVGDYRIFSANVKDFLDGLVGGFTTARFKTLPDAIYNSSNEVKSAFITSLFDCDSGFIKGNKTLEFSTASSNMADGVQKLLLTLGVVSLKKAQKVKKYPDHTYWKLIISSKNLDILFDGVMTDTIKYKELDYKAKRNTNIDVVYGASETLSGFYDLGRGRASVNKGGSYFLDGKYHRFKIGYSKEPTKELTFERIEKLLHNFNNECDFIKEQFREYGSFLVEILNSHYFHDKVKEKHYE